MVLSKFPAASVTAFGSYSADLSIFLSDLDVSIHSPNLLFLPPYLTPPRSLPQQSPEHLYSPYQPRTNTSTSTSQTERKEQRRPRLRLRQRAMTSSAGRSILSKEVRML